MNTCTVQPDQRVFAVYAGLTAGGYDIKDRMNKLVIIPNPLQAWRIADGVMAQGTTYLILARPDSGSIMHEALHSLFAPALECVRSAVD